MGIKSIHSQKTIQNQRQEYKQLKKKKTHYKPHTQEKAKKQFKSN
jgi:hypothetical protein